MSAAADPLLTVESVTKTYGRIRALDEVSLAVRKGTVHALVGPNGSGKSTLVRALLRLEPLDGGAVRDCTAGPRGLRVAYQPQVPALYEYLTVREFVTLAARLAAPGPAGRVDEVLELFELSPAADQLVHTTSVGTRMKIALAAAIVQDPEVLVLDEPTNAVDAVGVGRLKECIRGLRTTGTAVLLATHMIDFADGLCDDITVLRAGRVQYTGPMAGLRQPGVSVESTILALIDRQ